MVESPFLLLCVREGREEFAKAEIAMRFLGAKFAFSRPGFLSFKAGKMTETAGGGALWKSADLESLIFPLRTALFAGKVSKKADGPWVVSGMVEKLPACRHLHLIDYRDSMGSEESFARRGNLSEWDAESPGLLAALEPVFARTGKPAKANEKASIGESILQIFRITDREFWVGVSVLRDSEFGWPGGESGFTLPATAPSRAYLKLEEAISLLERALGTNPMKKGDRAIEVGSAPGGACYALLERGLRVIGVDRGEMAPSVAKHVGFSQVVSSVGDWVMPNDLSADWLLVDMNAEPSIAARETRALLEKVSPGLKGIFFTLKMNREQYAVSGERLARAMARELKLRTYFLKHLPSNHQEFAFFGVR